jgi:hypothetical protein
VECRKKPRRRSRGSRTSIFNNLLAKAIGVEKQSNSTAQTIKKKKTQNHRRANAM